MGKKYTTDEIHVGGHNLNASMMVTLNSLVDAGLHSNAGYLLTSGGTLTGTIYANGGIHMGNTNLTNVNHITINDPGSGEGIEWLSGNGWKIFESNDSNSNGAGNLQFSVGSVHKFRVDTSGHTTSIGSSRAPIFYDSNNTNYYLNPASTSTVNVVNFDGYSSANGGFQVKRNLGTTAPSWETDKHTLSLENSDAGYLSINFHRLGYTNHNIWYTGTEFITDDTWRSIIDMRAPSFYDSNDTGYYLNPAGTSNLSALNAATINRNPVVTLSGDVTGNATMTNLGSINITTTVADNSHSHTPASIGAAKFVNNAYLNSSTTTSAFISELINDYGCFQDTQVTIKCAWSYSGNSNLNTGHPTIGTIELAGCVIETWGGTYKHVRITRPNTGTGGHGVYEYNDQSSGYAPGWREIWTSESDGSGSGLDADLLDGQHASAFQPAGNYLTTIGKAADSNLLDGIDSTQFMRSDITDTFFSGQTSALAVENHTAFTRLAFNELRFYEWDSGGDNLILNNGYVSSDSSFRAPVFYDSDDTGYYVNPNSRSRFNEIQTSDSGATPRYDTAFYVIQGQHWYGDTGSQLMYIGESGNPVRLRGNLRIGGNANADSGMNLTVDGNSNATSSFRAPIFYDMNNTGYYLNPASSSMYNTAQGNYLGLGAGANTSGSYRLNMGGSIDMNNNHIDYVAGLHFNDNVRFSDDGNDSYLNFKYGDANNGGIKVLNGASELKGYLYGANNEFGLLDSDGQWAVRIQTGTNPLELRCDNNTEFQVYNSYTYSPGSSRAPIFYDSNNTGYYLNPASTSNINELNVVAKRTDFSGSNNWDVVGFGGMTNLHMQGHNQFWIGAGNGTWFTGTANSKTQASGLAADASQAHDLLLSTMPGTVSNDRGITFAVDSNGAGSAGWRLGKFHSGTDATDSMFAVDGQIRAKGGYTDEYDYYADDYSSYYNDGQAHWSGDTAAGWHKPSIVASSAIQIQSGNKGTNTRKPQIQFHQYGYGGPAIEYDGPNKKLQIGMIGGSSADRFNTFSLKFGSNEAFVVNTNYASHNSDMRAPLFYDSNNTAYYLDPASTSILHVLSLTGDITVGSSQTSSNIYMADSNGTTRRIHNNSNRIGFLTSGNAWGSYCSNNGDWTTDMISYAGASMRAPIFYDSNDTSYYVNPATTSIMSRVNYINNTIPIVVKVNSGYKSWAHHISSNDDYVLAPSTTDGSETWDWNNGFNFKATGDIMANNFLLRSDERLKTKIADLPCDNIDVAWKSFELKSDKGNYRTGVIAQELEKTNPEFVDTDDKGFKSVKYVDLLIAKIAELEARLEKIEK